MENGFSINRDDNQVKKGIDKSKDELIAKNSSFSKILDEKEKIETYNKFILKQTQYMNGTKRKKLSKIFKRILFMKDYLYNS